MGAHEIGEGEERREERRGEIAINLRAPLTFSNSDPGCGFSLLLVS